MIDGLQKRPNDEREHATMDFGAKMRYGHSYMKNQIVQSRKRADDGKRIQLRRDIANDEAVFGRRDDQTGYLLRHITKSAFNGGYGQKSEQSQGSKVASKYKPEPLEYDTPRFNWNTNAPMKSGQILPTPLIILKTKQQQAVVKLPNVHQNAKKSDDKSEFAGSGEFEFTFKQPLQQYADHLPRVTSPAAKAPTKNKLLAPLSMSLDSKQDRQPRYEGLTDQSVKTKSIIGSEQFMNSQMPGNRPSSDGQHRHSNHSERIAISRKGAGSLEYKRAYPLQHKSPKYNRPEIPLDDNFLRSSKIKQLRQHPSGQTPIPSPFGQPDLEKNVQVKSQTEDATFPVTTAPPPETNDTLPSRLFFFRKVTK